jgi:hypothetical protein
MFNRIDPWYIALAFIVVMLASWGVGWRIGRRLHPEPGEDPGSKFIDATMALLGLLLAFSFSMSLGRHDQRRFAVVAESNAIGDFYTCASVLKEPIRSQLQALIRDYAQQQLERLPEQLPGAVAEDETLRRNQATYARMTDLVGQAIDHTPIALALTNSLNNLTSGYASRRAMYDEIVPFSLIVLLLLSSLIPSLLTGLKHGETHKVNVFGTLGFILMVTFVVFITIDLNRPHGGVITVSEDPLARVIQSMTK